LLAASVTAFSQPFSFGVKAGVPVDNFIHTVQSVTSSSFTTTNRYVVGVTGELHLPFGFAIEMDALYRHFNYATRATAVDVLTVGTTSGNAWEFPLLAKYRFPSKVIRPYVDGGLAWDTLQGLKQTVTTTVLPSVVHTTTTSNPDELKNGTTMGLVLGAGLDVHLAVIHISPEVRFTRWTQQHFNATNLLSSNQNQVEVLVGITF